MIALAIQWLNYWFIFIFCWHHQDSAESTVKSTKMTARELTVTMAHVLMDWMLTRVTVVLASLVSTVVLRSMCVPRIHVCLGVHAEICTLDMSASVHKELQVRDNGCESVCLRDFRWDNMSACAQETSGDRVDMSATVLMGHQVREQRWVQMFTWDIRWESRYECKYSHETAGERAYMNANVHMGHQVREWM